MVFINFNNEIVDDSLETLGYDAWKKKPENTITKGVNDRVRQVSNALYIKQAAWKKVLEETKDYVKWFKKYGKALAGGSAQAQAAGGDQAPESSEQEEE